MAILLQAIDEGRIHSVVLKPLEVVVCRHGGRNRHKGQTFGDALAQAAQTVISEVVGQYVDEDLAFEVRREELRFIEDEELR